MPTYSIAQAKDQLSKLVKQTLAGEEVTITRHGKPVVELRAKAEMHSRRPSPELIEEIIRLSKTLPPLDKSAADIVREMRDEE